MNLRVCPQCGADLPPGSNFCFKCGARVEAEPGWDATVGERLTAALGPGYSLIGELGRGGFAVVYSVRDLRRNRYLAVKVMRPSLVAARTLKERFRREAELVSRLDHPNILPVLFTGKGSGLVYYAMPRVRGRSLREQLDHEGPLSLQEAVRVFGEIAAGLAHAHERGVVHRDIKPGNIMLDRSGRALIVDFGIAKALAVKGGSISITGEVIGTAEYMSPEQARGQTDIDERCDIYSLGVVGFEMLTAEVPFVGDSVHDTLAKHQSAPLPDVRDKRPDVPAAFAMALLQCMAKEPADRWPNPREAARAAGAAI
ncbi:MAG: protein kinase [Gemmatimonadales bacterium]|nr:protein kinase [Gemmatimonadales bacterium]NIN13345.1 protein kinase [Gemmatimonadales bacterium]NIN51348.1 protein kinase [Gemmatimonadales bacterium]NIP08812.1 protein kinase [Gemmatimonadales bacterium]NIQ99806.1 protein kinase [Gemmatimonadales bacterium]